MLRLGTFNINNYLPPAQPLVISSGVGFEYIRIINKSPLALNINIQGMGTIDYPEFFLEDIFLPKSYLGSLTIVPHQDITSVGHGVSGTVSINMYNHGEISRPQAQPLAQPAVTTTATGKPVFSATVGFGSTVTIQQNLNIFNPANSGVIGTFHAGRVYTNDSTGPTANMAIISGADQNLPNAVSAISHAGIGSPPVSVMHCTSSDAALGTPGSVPETMNMQQGVTQDFIAFPDVVLLYPGNNLFIDLSSGTTGHVARLTGKWTEDTIVPAILVQGPGGMASSVVNDNNPTGTTVLEATASGDSPSDILIQNNGTGTFKGLLQALGNFVTNLITNVSGNNLIINALGIGDTIQLQSQGTKYFQVGNGGIGFKTQGAIKAGYQMIGDTTIANAGTSVAHGLGIIPTVVIPVLDGSVAGVAIITINYGTMSATNFTAYTSVAGGTGNVRFFVMG